MKYSFVIGCLVMVLLFSGCKEDEPVKPETVYKIEGTVNFSGEWPESPADIRVVASKDFPIGSFDDLIQSGSIDGNGSVGYSLELDNDHYKFIGVIWKPENGNWGLASICGIYTNDQDFLTPQGVTIDSLIATTTGIDISVNRSRGKVLNGSKITGAVNLEGAWPDGYASAMVVASKADLTSESFDLFDLNMGTALERGTTSANYQIDVPADSNRTIAIAFLDIDGTLSEDAVYFAQNNNGLDISAQVIAENQSINGPDFNMELGGITSAIKGKINFIGTWPAATKEIRLITATTYPPTIDELIIGEAISPDVTSHKYAFYLEPDTYKLMGVAWRAEGTEWDVMSICGAYFSGEDSLAPSEVIIPDENAIVEDINIVVNRSKARKVTETYIQGSVQFNGTWPAEFTEARVVATTKFQIFPTLLPTMLDLAFSTTITAGSTSFDYNIKAFPGTFAAIGVVFMNEQQTLTIDDLLYSLDIGGLSIEPFEVEESTTVDGPDFTVQFP